MNDFLFSISVFGWIVITIAILGLWNLPKLWHGGRRSNLPKSPPPVGQPPDNGGSPFT